MFSIINIFTLKIPIRCTPLRNLYLSTNHNIFWQKLRKSTNEKLQLQSSESSKISEELFEFSKHKITEVSPQQQMVSDQFIKKMIFEEAILIYLQRYGKTRRGHVEFIYASLKKMKEFGVHQSLDVYKKILEIFPEVKMIPKTFWQSELFHYPKQQECALDILVAMEENGVQPDEDFGRMLFKRFGLHTSPIVRYQRMLYWIPKLKNANPWPVPQVLPNEPAELGRMALTRINPMKETHVTIHEIASTGTLKTWVASAQSRQQKSLISYLAQARPEVDKARGDDEQRVVYIDGPFPVWLRHRRLHYYSLSTELDRHRLEHERQYSRDQLDTSKVFFDNWYTVFDPATQPPAHFGNNKAENLLPRYLTSYEDDIGNRTILATCIPENENIGSLRKWINVLIQENPDLNEFKIVFRLLSCPSELVP